MIVGLVLRINFESLSKDNKEAQHLSLFIIGGLLLSMGSLCCEIVTKIIISKISAPTVGLGLIEAEWFTGFGSPLGRALGNIAIGFAEIGNQENQVVHGLQIYYYLTLAGIGFVLFVILLILSNKLQKLSYAQRIATDKAKRPSMEQSHIALPIAFKPFLGKPSKGLNATEAAKDT